MIVRLLLILAFLSAVVSSQGKRVTWRDPTGDGAVNVLVTMVAGASYGVGVGFARVEIENTCAQTQPVSVLLKPRRFFDGDVQSTRTVVAEPGISRFFLPMLIPPDQCQLEIVLGGVTFDERLNYAHSENIVSLFVADRSGRASHGVNVVEQVQAVYLNGRATSIPVTSEDLPTDWRMLTSFSMIVVDGATVVASGMTSEVQDAICRYAFAGGTVVISACESMPSGSLRDIGVKALNRVLPHGFGYIASVAAFESDRTGTEAVLAEIPELGSGLWPATSGLFPVQDIEGLGKAPVTVFVVVILAFAILVGPINFMILRRRKKPLLALVTVPVLGFGTTVVILAYGIIHDGFGVRGVARSCTLLDQGTHEAVSINTSTLFAGMAPSDLTMEPDSLVLSVRAGVDRADWVDRWSWDANQKRLDGGILPSRTVTPLLTVQQGPVRERLIVRRSGDTLELLHDGGIEPVGEVVLRDFDGQYWVGKGSVLRRVSNADGHRRFESLRGLAAEVSVAEEESIVRPVRLPFGVPRWGQRGTYATRVVAAPWLDDHGVSVDYDQQDHFVFGRMHAQDFVQ
ncbi:MAG: hypothetical protein ACI89X_001493 [Planctomycetota bacterium]